MSLDDEVDGCFGCMGCVGSLVCMTVSGLVCAWIGVGIGYVVGNVIDYIPLLNKVAPTLAEYVGFASDPNMNENFYQLSFGVSGFYGGLKLIPRLLTKKRDDD